MTADKPRPNYTPKPGSVRIQKPKPRGTRPVAQVDTRTPSGKRLPY